MNNRVFMRLLLIEDNAGDARLLHEMLKEQSSHAIEVTRVECMSEAEKYLAANVVDIVLLDLGLPDAQGAEAIRRARAAARHVPLVMMTVRDDQTLAAEALQGGAQDYLIKGQTSPRELLRSLQYAVDRNVCERALQESELRFRQLAETINDVFFIYDLSESRVAYVSPAYEEIWGRTCASLYMQPTSWMDCVHPDDRNDALEKFAVGSITGFDYEYRIVRPDGEIRWIQARGFPILDDGGKPYRMAGVASDITKRVVAANELHESERKIKSLNRVHAVLSGITALTVRVRDRDELFRQACRVAVEDGSFVMAWIGIVDLTAGVIQRKASAGDVRDFFETVPETFFECTPAGMGLANRAIAEMKTVISLSDTPDSKGPIDAELEIRGVNSFAFIPLVVSGEAIGVLALYATDAEGFSDAEEMTLLVELADNISLGLEHIQNTEKLNYLAYYDPVTGLANRALFLDRVAQMLSTEGDPIRKVAVLALDIERFKTVNEALGRQAGDELLTQIAGRLRRIGPDSSHFGGVAGDRFSALRSRSHLGRVGADHFAIVSTEAQNDEQFAHFTEAMLKQCFSLPFRILESDVRISAKVGIAVFPVDGADAETLLSNATAAVTKAKAKGEHYLFYAQEMNERSTTMLALENKLRQAYEKEEFVLNYQPKVDLETRRIVGVEALIRWQSPDQGLVPPIKFISLMEETGLILEVGAWALSKAAADHLRWKSMRLPAPRIAVNVSAIQLRKKDFVKTVVEAVRHGASAPGIDLEITESLIMEDIEANIEKLKEVRGLGLSIAIDDFGTGYSSLAYLAKLPVQTLKIDRSFVNTMLDDHDTMTMVQTIISLAHSLRLKVVAEGVESEEQAKMLRLLHCDEMQGYLFSKAVPFDALTLLLQEAENNIGLATESRLILARGE